MTGRNIGLVIGTNEYSDPKLSNLHFAVKDAEDMRAVLLNPDIGGFSEIVPLVNETKYNVKKRIEKLLLKDTISEDLVLIYFSGHGKLDFKFELNLLLKDTETDYLLTTALHYNFITDCIEQSKCKKIVIILDCCHGGAAGLKGDISKTLSETSGSGTFILSATTESNLAKEVQELENGIFTYFLLEGLRKGDADLGGDGLIDILELYEYASKKCNDEYSQVTTIKSKFEERIVIGKNPIRINEASRIPDISKTFTSSSTGMEFVFIPAGKFIMGSKEYDSERPMHNVSIEEPFYMGKYLVTTKQWKIVMGDNPSGFDVDDDKPVENISWSMVQTFIVLLNEMEGVGKYLLPSEAEWEYACCASTTTRYSFGDEESKIRNYAWYGNNSGGHTHSVGQKKPNPWGLYDMHGNVWEWVQDRWHDNYEGAPSDGSVWKGGDISFRVIRGGSWSNSARYCRSASRCRLYSDYQNFDVGFRLLRKL